MSTDPLESVVRPFQSGQISPSQTYFPAGQVGQTNVRLQYGHRSGSGKTLTGSYSESQSFYCAKAQNEKRKKKGPGTGEEVYGKEDTGDDSGDS